MPLPQKEEKGKGNDFLKFSPRTFQGTVRSSFKLRFFFSQFHVRCCGGHEKFSNITRTVLFIKQFTNGKQRTKYLCLKFKRSERESGGDYELGRAVVGRPGLVRNFWAKAAVIAAVDDERNHYTKKSTPAMVAELTNGRFQDGVPSLSQPTHEELNASQGLRR